MPPIIYTMKDVSLEYDDKPILDGINLSFYYGAKIGIVGENGAGKSTLLKIMAGIEKNFHGEASSVKGTTIQMVGQEPQLNPEKNVRENLEEAVSHVKQLLERYEVVGAKLGEDISPEEMEKLLAEMDRLQVKIDATDAWEIDRHLDIAADALVLPPDDADVTTLSGGERRRVALCQALLEKPDVLLLDEPTNHLDAETISWLENALREYPGTVIIVTHDRYFLDHITQWILEINQGKGIPYEGNYSAWLEQKGERLRLSEKKESERQRQLKREWEFLKGGQRAQQKKGKMREQRYDDLMSQKFEARTDDVLIQIPPGPKLGDRVITFNGVGKGFSDVELLKDVSFDMPRGAIVGVIGPNGAGKTTMMRMIMGEEQPDSGSIDIGKTVSLSYVDQNRDALDGAKTIWEEISGGMDDIKLEGRTLNSRAYVSRFNFRGPQQQKLVGNLSGGERNRVHLAKLLKAGGNVIMLDEPTNDLDVNTLRVLEESLMEFPACAIIISHDRVFLDRLCTHLLVFEGDGKVRWFEGNFADYEQQVLSQNPSLLENRRSKYKRLPMR